MTSNLRDNDIAIIGMASELPGASDYDRFWWNLYAGLETITHLEDKDIEVSLDQTADRSNSNYVRAASILEGADTFDAGFFGISAREAELLDPQQRVFLQCAWHALEDAGYDPYRYSGDIGVFAGARTNTYLANIYSNPDARTKAGYFEIGLGNDLAFLTTRTSHKLGLKGPSVSLHTACSTSLVGVHMASQSLRIGECDMALAGGVSVNVPQKSGYVYQRGGILSPDGHCRAFDERAEGTVFGSGVGVVVLKLAKRAIDDGDLIHAIIKGSAVNNDGSMKAGFTAPSIGGQARVIRRALANAAVPANSIGYIEAHGTGTHLGDPIEVRALTKAFSPEIDRNFHCRIGSVKANIGHLDAAAGIAGLIKTVLILKHKQIPPLVHFTKSNPQMDLLNGPFIVNDKLVDWESDGRPRRASISAFGIGGTNAHVILEEATTNQQGGPSRENQLLLLSARSGSSLSVQVRDLTRYLRHEENSSLADVAYTLATGRSEFEQRAAIVCSSTDEALRELDRAAQSAANKKGLEQAERPVVFMFPGQGAQEVNMGRSLYLHEAAFRNAFDEAAAIAEQHLGMSLHDVIYPEASRRAEMASLLNETWVTQPALFVVEYAMARFWESLGVNAVDMIGHSIGEYVAACLCGVFTLSDALTVVTARGRLMATTEEGAMIAIALPETDIQQYLHDELALSAVNGPAQCVLAGTMEAVAAIERKLSDAGIATQRLKTSHAFHSPLINSITEGFQEVLASILMQKPTRRFISNLTGRWIEPHEATDPEYWVQHALGTVRFHEGLLTILAESRPALLDIGPGRALTRFARSVPDNMSIVVSSYGSRNPSDTDQRAMLKTLGDLWLNGSGVDWTRYFQGERRLKVSLPTYPFERTRYWIAADSTTSPAVAGCAGKKVSDIDRWIYLPSWKHDVLPTTPEHDSFTYLVVVDERGVADTIIDRLEIAGNRVIRVTNGGDFATAGPDAYVLPLSDRSSYDRLVDSLTIANIWPERILHFGAVTGDEQHLDYAGFQTCQSTGYTSILFLCQSLARTGSGNKSQIVVIADHLADPTGMDIDNSPKSTIPSLCIVISQEDANLSLRCIDIDVQSGVRRQPGRTLDALMEEVKRSSTDKLVALRGSNRWIRTYEPTILNQTPLPRRQLRYHGVYVITGGLGNIGLLLAAHLARSVEAKLVLVSRRTIPAEESWSHLISDAGTPDPLRRQLETLRNIRLLGAEVLTLTADVASEADMKEVVQNAQERFGAIHGVLHAAGVTSGRSLYRPYADFTESELGEQFRPKVQGTYVLQKVLEGLNLDFCLLFSSNAAVLGGLGYLAYSAANAFMDGFAAKRKRFWISADWDPWSLGTKTHASYRTATDVYSMTEEESLRAFDLIIGYAPPGQVIVATGDLPARLKTWASTTETNSVTQYPRPEIDTEYIAPRNDHEHMLAGIWRELLGVDRVGIDDNFFDLGGHSLLAIRLMGRINQELGVDVPVAKLFEAPTVAQIAVFLGTSGDASPDGVRDDALRILAELK